VYRSVGQRAKRVDTDSSRCDWAYSDPAGTRATLFVLRPSSAP
jgi:hypothetical protein